MKHNTTKRSKIAVKRGIPIPPKPNSKGYSDVLRVMKIGDSFEIGKQQQQSVYVLARRAGVKITMRTDGNGNARVWRTA